MLKTIKLLLMISAVLILGACGFTVEKNEEMGGGSVSGAEGTTLAGEEAIEITGTLKSIESEEEVIVTVESQDTVYRLSQDAQSQIENNEVETGSEVTFTTYSIGDDQETIDQFIND